MTRSLSDFAHEHPWMTFFLVGSALSSVVVMVRGYDPATVETAKTLRDQLDTAQGKAAQTVSAIGDLFSDLKQMGYGATDDAAQGVAQPSSDLAKRAAELQQASIVQGATQAAQGFKTTAAQIESDLTKKIAAAALIGGGAFVFAKKKGWI